MNEFIQSLTKNAGSSTGPTKAVSNAKFDGYLKRLTRFLI